MAPLALGMGRADRIHRRLANVLDSARDHRPLRGRTLAWTGIFMLAVALGLGSMAISFSPSEASADEPGRRIDTVSSKPLAGPEIAGKTSGDRAENAKAAADNEKALLKKLAEVRNKLAKHYVAPLDDKELAEQAIKGLLKGLKDPYTDYLSAKDLSGFEAQVAGKVSGIGVQLEMVSERLVVTTPLEGSPALKAGIRPGDMIEAIDGKATRGLTMNDAVQRILGSAGSVVKLKVVHPEGVVEELAITRGAIRLRTVIGFLRGPDGSWEFLLEPEHKIGYLHVKQFARGTAGEVREAIVGLQKSGLKGLILDLRFCPGGLLDQALEVSKLFVAKGVLLTTRGPGKEEMVFRADGTSTLGTFPVIVLVNELTASAAEIVAGALRDHQRAVLLGTRTYGKGSVQTIVMLDDGSALKVTTAQHYLPSGRNIQKRPGERSWGVDPSVGFYIPLTTAQTKALQQDAQRRALVQGKKDARGAVRLTPQMVEDQHADPQLAAALRSMTARLTGGEFLKVGKDNGLLLDQALHLEEMRNRRERLIESINELEREMAELQHGPGRKKTK
jgi:carboxyl-terminal processing protease